MAAGDSTNLDIQVQLNKLISERNELLRAQSESLRSQIDIVQKLKDSLVEAFNSFDSSRVEELTGALDGAAGAAGRLGGATSSVSDALSGAGGAASVAGATMSSSMSEAAISGAMLGSKISLIVHGIQLLGKIVALPFKAMAEFASRALAQLRAVYQTAKSIYMTFQSIAMVTFSTLSKWMDTLQAQGARLADAMRRVKEAKEDVRDALGDIASNEGKAVIDAYDSMTKSSNNLAGSGRSLASVYGYGPDGMISALNDLSKNATEMGALFSSLKEEFAESAQQLIIFQKGLGLTGEEMRGLEAQAKARGKTMVETQREIGNLATQMSKKYGISSKIIGKELGMMTSQSGKFGKMTKEMAVTSITYLNKLGMSMKDVEGLMGAWDDFETAATNASKLAQAFGMNVDALQMMKEQDPSKRLAALRQSFAATGRSAASLSRVERDLLASSSGLDANMVELALSAENMGKSYEEIMASAKESGAVQMSEAEILQDLSKNIKEMIRPIQYLGGLLENFFSGFSQGWMGMTGEGSPMMKAISEAIAMFEEVGYTVGRMFGTLEQNIPIFKALTDYFNKMKESIKALTGPFEKFFKTVSEKPGEAKQALKELFDSIKKEFNWLLNPNDPINAGISTALWDAFKFVFDAVLDLANSMLPTISEKVLGFLDSLIETIPEMIGNIGKESPDKAASPLSKFLSGVFDLALKSLDKIWILIKDSFIAALENPNTRNYVLGGTIALLLYVFGPAMIAAMGAVVTTLLSTMLILFKFALQNPELAKKVATYTLEILSKAFGALGSMLGGLGRLLGSVFEVVGQSLVRFLTTPFKMIGGILTKLMPELLPKVLGFVGKFFSKAFIGGIAEVATGPVGWAVMIGEWILRGFRMLLDWIGRDFFVNILGETFGGGWYDFVMTELNLLLDGIDDIFGGLWDIVKGIFTLDFDTILNGFKHLFLGIGSVLWSFIRTSPFGLIAKGIDAVFGTDMVKSIDEALEKPKEKAADVAKSINQNVSESINESGKDVMEKMNSVSSMVDDYADKSEEDIARQAQRINKGIDNLQLLLSQVKPEKMSELQQKINSSNFGAMQQAIGQIEETFGILSKFSLTLEESFNAFDKIGELASRDISSGIHDAISKLSNAMTQLSDSMGLVNNAYGGLLKWKDKGSAYAELVKTIVEDINTISAELDGLDAFNVDVKMTNVGDTMGVKNAVVNFERKPIDVTVNVNVQMDSTDLTTNVSRTALRMAMNGSNIGFPSSQSQMPYAPPSANQKSTGK